MSFLPSRATAVATALAASAALILAGCGSGSTSTDSGATTGAGGDAAAFPVTIEHHYGKTTIEKKPVRVATVGWANHEVPLALGIVPVGMAEALWGDDDNDGVLPWVEDKLTELKAQTPPLFDEDDGIDFEGVANTKPDVILAAYSGLTQEEYDTLSKIAPVVAYPEVAWGTSWQDMVTMNSTALGLKAEGEALVKDLESFVKDEFAKNPELAGKKVLWSYFDPKDLSQIGMYTTHDTRPGFLKEFGMGTPAIVETMSKDSKDFYLQVSSEKADEFKDVDVAVTYAPADLLGKVQADPLLAQIPAVKKGAVAILPDATPLAASANPSPLSIKKTLPDYLKALSEALKKNV